MKKNCMCKMTLKKSHTPNCTVYFLWAREWVSECERESESNERKSWLSLFSLRHRLLNESAESFRVYVYKCTYAWWWGENHLFSQKLQKKKKTDENKKIQSAMRWLMNFKRWWPACSNLNFNATPWKRWWFDSIFILSRVLKIIIFMRFSVLYSSSSCEERCLDMKQ